jgi:modulator of FtsH protease
MQPELIPNRSGYPAGTREVALEQSRVLRNTYLLLALTMVPTVIGAFIGINTGGIIMQHPFISFFVMLGAVIGLQFAIVRYRNSGIGVVLLLGMTFLLGWFLGPLLAIALTMNNGPQLVGLAAGGTGVIFFAMATIATTTKRDFSFMGKFLFVGVILLIVAMLANLFFQIPALSLTLSAIAVLLFSAFILYDVSRIVNGGETNYVMATMSLFLNVYNIFISLLNILLAFSGNRE